CPDTIINRSILSLRLPYKTTISPSALTCIVLAPAPHLRLPRKLQQEISTIPIRHCICITLLVTMIVCKCILLRQIHHYKTKNPILLGEDTLLDISINHEWRRIGQDICRMMHRLSEVCIDPSVFG